MDIKVAVMLQARSAGVLPSTMEDKLAQISRRQATLSVLRAAAIGASVLFGTMVVAMLIDWQLTLFSTGVRTALTATSVLLSVAALLLAGLPQLAASLQQIKAAASADDALPQLEERWQTVVGATSSGRHTSATATAMLQQVTSEAVAIGRVVQPERVADPKSLHNALKVLAACAALLLAFLATNWPQTSVLLRRFLAPAANITATTVNCSTGDVTIARGELVELVANVEGLRPTNAVLTIARDNLPPETVELDADKKTADRFAHRMSAEETFRYRVRAGDGQTEWHTVTVVDYPELAEVRLTIVAPAYLHRPNVEKTIFPGRLKVMQGSVLQLRMRPKTPLERLELRATPEGDSEGQPPAAARTYAITPDKDGSYRFDLRLTENLSISPHLWNAHGLTNQDRTVCRIQVIADNAPVARVLAPTDEMSVAADEVVDIKFEALDDHGISKAELVVYDESAKEEGKPAPVLKVLPIPLEDQQLAKHVVGTTQLDLKQLDLKPGTRVSYAVRVTDNRAVENEQTLAVKPKMPATDESDQSQPLSADSIAEGPPGDDAERTHGESKKGSEGSAAKGSDQEPANVAGTEKPPGTEVALDLPDSDPTEKSDELTRPNRGVGALPSSDKNAVAKARSGKDMPREGAKSEGSPSDRETDRATVISSESDGTPSPDAKTDGKPDASDTPDQAAEGSTARPADASGKPRRQKPSKPQTPAAKDDVGASPTKSTGVDEPRTANGPTGMAPSVSRASSPEKTKPAPNEVAPPVDAPKPGEPVPADNSANDQPTVDATKKPDDAEKLPQPSQPGNSPGGQSAQGENKKSNNPEHAPPPPAIAMSPQQSESGQNGESNRPTLKITERLSAIAEARESLQAETSNVRERVVEIDALLADTETGLTRIVNREVPDNDHTAQYTNLDKQLGTVEGRISALRKETRDGQFAFVGLQMLDIGRSQVTPARERVFAAIREPVSASSGGSRAALQQIVRARELLAALLKRYDRVAREKQLAEGLKEGVKMYEVYVEKMQELMREARQNQNPLERKMAVIEVDQEYLDRYAEVLTLRREMLTEFGRILGDDPRLLARYLDLVKRRRTSLRDQLSELAKQQAETFAELSGWQAADIAQREDLWTQAVELRMQTSTQLARDSAELGERIEKQFPLVLEAAHPTSAKVIALGREITALSRGISLEAKRQIRESDAAIDLRPKATQFARLFVELDAALEQLGFENSKEAEVTLYVSGRVLESRTVADQAQLWKQAVEHAHGKRYHDLVELDQHRLAIATELLRVDMLAIEPELEAQFQQLAQQAAPEPIVAQIRQLQRLMQEITFEQTGAEFALSENRLAASEKLLKRSTENFARAEELFDELRRAIVAALDELAVQNPNIADLEDPKIDEFFNQLEREPNLDARLGIPERPRNLRVIADSLSWQEDGPGQLGAMAEEATSRMKQEQKGLTLAQGDEGPSQPEPEKPEAGAPEMEPTDEEREDQERLTTTREELEQALEAHQERAKDPTADPEELKELEQAAKEAQKKLEKIAKGMASDKLWKPMKADLEKTLAQLKEGAKENPPLPGTSERAELLTRDLQRLLDQIRNEPNPDNRWKMVAEFERKKAVLKAVARGERIPDEQWNKLLSQLDDGLWQVGGRSLPEEYRKAIEQYQEQIRKLTNSGKDDDR
jgi:hypothetical protein